MNGKRWCIALALGLSVAVAGAGCSGRSSASSTPAPPSNAAAAATQPPQSNTTQASQPTAVPAPTAKPTEQPAASAAPPLAGALGDEYSFDQVATVSGLGSQTLKMAFKKGKVRMETSAGGQDTVMIADPTKNSAYVLFPAQNQAMKVPYQQFEGQEKDVRDPGVLTQDLATGQTVGSESIDGKQCDIYAVSTTYGSTKVWIWKEKGLPLRAEITGGGQTATIEYKNFQVGGLPDSLFELPAGVQVMDLGNLSGMMPGATPTGQ